MNEESSIKIPNFLTILKTNGLGEELIPVPIVFRLTKIGFVERWAWVAILSAFAITIEIAILISFIKHPINISGILAMVWASILSSSFAWNAAAMGCILLMNSGVTRNHEIRITSTGITDTSFGAEEIQWHRIKCYRSAGAILRYGYGDGYIFIEEEPKSNWLLAPVRWLMPDEIKHLRMIPIFSSRMNDPNMLVGRILTTKVLQQPGNLQKSRYGL